MLTKQYYILSAVLIMKRLRIWFGLSQAPYRFIASPKEREKKNNYVGVAVCGECAHSFCVITPFHGHIERDKNMHSA